jgi:ATP-dependent RNA helicase DDX51/DBP6
VPGLSNVISYDVANSVLSYVHRVGRTARAGKEGCAWTLLEHREGRWFWGEIGGKGAGQGDAAKSDAPGIRRRNKIQRVSVAVDDEDTELRDRYAEALKKLGEEARGS